MKTILTILLLIFLFGCQTEQEKFDEMEAKEISSGIRNDTIFLKYRFGMSPDEFKESTDRLKSEGKVYIKDGSYLAYKMKIDDGLFGDVEALFSPEYFNNKLYKLNVFVKSTNEEMQDAELTQIQLAVFLQGKYGHFLKVKNVLNDYEYCNVKGNREIIIFNGITDARIFFTDLFAEKEATQKENKEQLKEIDKAKKDI